MRGIDARWILRDSAEAESVAPAQTARCTAKGVESSVTIKAKETDITL